MNRTNFQEKRPVFTTLAELVNHAFTEFADLPFLCEINGDSITYRQGHQKIREIQQIFRKNNLRPGDKVALLGKNSIQWGLIYIAAITHGIVIVPILHEFNALNVHNIINMSDSKLIFISTQYLDKIENTQFKYLEKAVLIEDFEEVALQSIPLIIQEIKQRLYHFRDWIHQYIREYIHAGESLDYEPKPNEIAAIVYTSGTTGSSKGVILTQNNLASDVQVAVKFIDICEKDRFLSLLPLAHTYECSLVLFGAMTGGAAIYYLKQKPSPKVLMDAFSIVKPTLVASVPLIIEKIYRKRIQPHIEGNFWLRQTTHINLLRRAIYKKAVKELLKALGGNLRWFGIGGAPLNPEVERFLFEGGFPYSIGYGMTECSPLITGSSVSDKKKGSCGFPVEGIEIRIADPDPKNGVGEVQVRGPIVTQGYYRNAEETARLFTADGFLKTGDLGYIKKNYLYLKGRSKNMILGPSGENIYPEEIEQLLNQNPAILESLILYKNNRLRALLFPDYDFLRQELDMFDQDDQKIKEKMDNYFQSIFSAFNHHLPEFSRISEWRLMDEEFEKTPTQKIKRFIYND